MAETEEMYKECPKCQVMTEKAGGCNLITCPNCKTKWCFSCNLEKDTRKKLEDNISAKEDVIRDLKADASTPKNKIKSSVASLNTLKRKLNKIDATLLCNDDTHNSKMS